jgi:hypothetical protein
LAPDVLDHLTEPEAYDTFQLAFRVTTFEDIESLLREQKWVTTSEIGLKMFREFKKNPVGFDRTKYYK